MSTEPEVTTARLSPLFQVLANLQGANIRPTPLNISARATDVGLSDADISTIVDDLAAERGLTEVAA